MIFSGDIGSDVIQLQRGGLFANPATGKPYHQEQIQKSHLTKAATAVEIKGGIGWHAFRHSYRSWMDDTGAPLTFEQELMRHASVPTTMNVYGKAMTDSKRQAHSKVVQMVLKEPDPVLEKQDLAIGA